MASSGGGGRAPVLLGYFGWILHLPAVSDWLPAYNRFADAQRCWRRPLARVEAAAADGGPADTARY